MPVRSSMASLIALVRRMIGDPASDSQQFENQEVHDRLDAYREDVRYEGLIIVPTIINTASTGNEPVEIFSDFYSRYHWWEEDVVLQAQYNGQAWVKVTPVNSDYIIGHWQFEADVFNTGTAPGQYPPVFATGKTYDVNAAAADLLEMWAALLTGAYDITADGQSLRRSQLMTAKLQLADRYRKNARPRIVKMVRDDIMAPLSSRRVRLLDTDDTVRQV